MRWNLIFLGLAVFGFVLQYAPAIAKNLGINMPPWLSAVLSYFGIVVAFVGIFLVFLGFVPGIIKNHIAFVASFTLAGAVLSGLGAWVYLRYREVVKQTAEPPADKTGDITWSFDTDPGVHFLAMVGGQGQEPWVDSFQAHGRNNLDEPISRVSGFVRSDVTNAQFPIRFVIGGQRVPPEDTSGIPRKAEFVIASDPFPSSDRRRRDTGLTASRFLVEFATFTFVFEYDGKKFVRHFTNEEIWNQVAAFQRASQTSVPSVIPKKPTSRTEG